ncbi:hypothetical protein BT96DRAFT_408295 [Gymnopus androsaceus JB14]|uniref:Uncharacterized protein n=1 Tax=Gymnopus androsaceus JB14 TaxID=1447944 RepID=A0A6A4GTP2_9AGAR|nr:hypothetical protein BT96DRAFT_408295 [Gymnopus androsaceus JB14]
MDHGYFRWVMISGSALLVFCLVMTSFCQEQQFWQQLECFMYRPLVSSRITSRNGAH